MKEVVARLDELSLRELGPLLRGLSDAGADKRLARVLRKLGNPQRAVEVLQREFGFELAEEPGTRRRHLINGRFTTPDEQIENVRRWDREKDLGLKSDVWTNLPRPPAWPRGQHLAVVLVPHLATPELTADTLWGLAASRQKSAWRDPRILEKPLTFLRATPWTPGLHWMTINLGANWDKKNGISPKDVGEGFRENLLFAVLAAAAHHPAWVRRMDGEKTPYVWAPGCLIEVEERREAGPHAICLGYSNGEVMLCLDWLDGRDKRYAIPTLVS